MRNLFLLLVLANLGFAAWHSWYTSAPSLERPVVRNSPSISLLVDGEVVPPPFTNPIDPVANAESADQQLICMSIGPLANRLLVENAVDTLEAAAFDVEQRIAQGEVWLGYWVYIDAIDTQDAANDIVRQLNEADIDEAYVIADGNNGNLVSLGVFSVQERAQQRLEDARALGFEVTVTDRSQPGDVFWLDVTAADGLPFSRSDMAPLQQDESLQYLACAEAE